MSHSYYYDDSDGPIMKPRPKRAFELSSAPPSAPPTPPSEAQTFSSSLQPPSSSMDGSDALSRTRSILNLTSSTLFGIYQPTGYSTEREDPSTPWGTGAETPVDSPRGRLDISRWSIPDDMLRSEPNGVPKAKRISKIPPRYRRPRRGFTEFFLPILGRLLVLFAVGVLYGLLIGQLHDRQEIAPIKVEGLNRSGWPYLTFWGVAAVLLGHALPYTDKFWAPQRDEDVEDDRASSKKSRNTDAWLDVVRSIGAFVGIAFAIRKLPWQSTLQLSLTLALANPAIWYLIDRSPPGFIISTIVALSGTAMLLSINPALIPSPSPAQGLQGYVARLGRGFNRTANAFGSEQLILGVFSQESVGVATWIASVLFVSSVCFGNIGRRLAPQRP